MTPRTLTRGEALKLLREKCLALVDEEHSLCEVASRLKILCGGFSRWSFHELKQRHDWIVKHQPTLTRRELEELANRWQLARQYVLGTELACDTQSQREAHRLCRGWDEHSDEDLARYCQELTGEEFRVLPDPPVASPG